MSMSGEHKFITPRLLLLIAGLLLLLSASAVAIGVESVSTGSAYSSSLTVAHTVAGSDRLLLVSVHLNEAATVSSVTCDGLALTQRSSDTHSGGNPKVELWYRIAPPEGAVNVVVTLQGGVTANMTVGVVSLAGVNQSSPFYSATSNEGTNGDPMVVVSSRAGDLVLDFLASTSTGVPTVGSNQTVIVSRQMGGSSHYGVASTEAGSNAVEMRWLLSQGTQPWVILAVSVAPSYYSYYVSTSGNDGADGLTPGTAWASIDNGEDRGLIAAGDTVNVLAGTYNVTAKMTLSADGTSERRIVYRVLGGDVLLDGGNKDIVMFEVNGDYTSLEGFKAVYLILWRY